jgi:hypothetical protein
MATAKFLLRPRHRKTFSTKNENSTVSSGVASPIAATSTSSRNIKPNEMRVGWVI